MSNWSITLNSHCIEAADPLHLWEQTADDYCKKCASGPDREQCMQTPAMFYAINIRLPRNTTNLEYIDLVDAGISFQLYPTIPPNINYFRTLPWRIYHGRFILYTRHEESACHNTTPWDRSHDPLLEATQQWGVAALPWCHQSKGLFQTDAINTINHCESTKESKEWLNHVYTQSWINSIWNIFSFAAGLWGSERKASAPGSCASHCWRFSCATIQCPHCMNRPGLRLKIDANQASTPKKAASKTCCNCLTRWCKP